MGEVWANMLHIVYAALVSAFGWTKDSTVDPTLPQGNVVFFHLLFDALLLQPCNPTCEFLLAAVLGCVYLSNTDTDSKRALQSFKPVTR